MTLPGHRVTRYVEPLREGGSLPGLMEADDDGLYVVKLSGAGQGVRALVAEIVVGELARAVGLRVPDIALLDLGPELGRAEPDPEIQELLRKSVGTNVGLDFLPASLPFAVAAGHPLDPVEAAKVVWLDLLTTNVDRTGRNTNLLWWHGQLWLIDHGAALYRQHATALNAGEADRPFPQLSDHVLLPLTGDTPEARLAAVRSAHDALAPLVTQGLLDEIVAGVPQDWLQGSDYAAYLLARVEVVGRDLAAASGLDAVGAGAAAQGAGGRSAGDPRSAQRGIPADPTRPDGDAA